MMPLETLSPYRRNQLVQHAVQCLALQQQIAAEHGGLQALMLAQSGHEDGAGLFVANRHYPRGDRIDYRTGGQYFYHCHREDIETQEHGHFHLFLRAVGWPKSYGLPNIPARDKYRKNPMTHLVSVGLNRSGEPIRLFTVNRWVSHECWFFAERLNRLTNRFHVAAKLDTPDSPWRLVDAWITHLVALYRDEIHQLQHQRDATIKAHPNLADPYHEKSLEELSSRAISVPETALQLM